MFSRRQLVAGMCLAAMSWRGAALASEKTVMEIVPLWPGEPPGGGGPVGPEQDSIWGAASHISTPDFRVFLPEKPNGAGMLVIAGGGYTLISRRSEGDAAARWLNKLGYAAFVLTYRLPGEGWHDGPRAPLADAQRAMRMIRSMASKFGISPQQLGVLGFSAGGYLAGLTATRSDFEAYRPVDDADRLSARPNRAALVYPIITLQPPFDHTSTRRQMLGPQPPPAAVAEWSVESHVDRRTPPILLVHAADDPIASFQHSLIMENACKRAHVAVELVRLAAGGHGFGMSAPGKPSFGWSDHLRAWLDKTDKAQAQMAMYDGRAIRPQ